MQKNTVTKLRSAQQARRKVFESFKGLGVRQEERIKEERSRLIPLPTPEEIAQGVVLNKERQS